jgi:hypothetical protein
MKTFKSIFVLLAVVVFSVVLVSCESTVTDNTPVTPQDNFQLSVWDYSDNYYFVDTLYKRCFNEYYNDSLTNYSAQNMINDANHSFEVWVQCNVTDSNKKYCVGKVMLCERPPQGYDTSIINPGSSLGDKFSGFFRKLEESEYYYNTVAGFVGLKITIPDNYYLGVVYNNNSNQYFGKGRYESTATDTLILKLIKIDSPNPYSTPTAWNLKMKNVYRIPYTNLQSTSTINVKYNYNNVFHDTIPGYSIPMITMTKLDRFNNGTYLPPPDGKFDWLANKTIYPASGDIVFPILEPFGNQLKSYGLDSNYAFYEI